MSFFSRRRHSGRRSPRERRALTLETLETRTLFSFSIGGITIPGISSSSGFTLPSYTNVLNLGSLESLTDPSPSDSWWLSNTGQTLSNPTSGPATGTPGADINALNAWTIATGSSNVVIAVLDTGIDLQNAGLASVLWTNPGEIAGDGIDNDGNGKVDDVHGWNFLDNSADVSDNFVHGTAVAAAIHSVAPGVSILPVEIGTAAGTSSQDVIDGINYLIGLKKAGVNIVAINASYLSFAAPSSGEVNAIKAAGDNGMLYVAAAGNAGLNLDSLIPNLPASLAQYIGQYLPSNLLFVAATDNQDHLASFSDYGANTVAVGAPGVDMTLPIPGGLYVSLSGTSFAAPMVSGIVGLLKSRLPGATMAQVKAAVLNSGDPDPALAGKTITGRRVDAFNALNYLVGNQPPVGSTETLSLDAISGWAFEPNLGSAPATVQIVVDGSVVATLTADQDRPDLADRLGSAGHGFSFDTSTLNLGYGKHPVKVYVLDNATGRQTLIGQGTLVVNVAPTGDLETVGTKVVTGWAFDSDTPLKYTQVKLFLDGKAWMTTSANIDRPDLAETLATTGTTRHGYKFTLGTMRAGIHRVDLYAVDTLTGALTLIGTDTLSSNRPVTGVVETLTTGVISGWAFDADVGAGAVQVQYQVDDGAPVRVTANRLRADLAGSLGSKNHGFLITLPQLTAGDHTITVCAIDPANKQLVQLARQEVTVAESEGNALPTGEVTSLTGSLIAGTVTDALSPVRVRIDVDGKAGTPFLAAATGDAATWSFSWTPTFTGVHRVDVYAYDDQTNVPVLLARELVNYTAPSALVESFTDAGASGWALAPSAPRQQAWVRLDIDEFSGALVTASLARPDLQLTLGSLNTGFSLNMPAVAPGEHTARLYLVDPVTLQATLLDEHEFTV